MQYAVFDLFGGTTQFFEHQYEALEAADHLLKQHYQSAWVADYGTDDPLAPEVVIMRVTHRAAPAIGSMASHGPTSPNYHMEPVACCTSTQA